MNRQRRILVIRQDRVGDVVLSTPVPRELKLKFPNCFVAVFVRRYAKDIYINNPNVDEIILLEDLQKAGFWSAVQKIRKYKFTDALMLLPNEWINYLLFCSGIRSRVGVGRKFYHFLTFTKEVSRNKYIPLRHEADYSMDLARKIGVNTNNYITEIFLSPNEKDGSKIKRKKLLGDKKFLIGVHTSSGNSAPNWNSFQYKKLIKSLSEHEDFVTIVTDLDKNEDFVFDNVKFSEIGKDLRHLITTINSLDVLISSSTGPMHIAAALGIKTVSLFCPLTACSPKLWGPIGNESKVILPEKFYCESRCPGDPKKCNFEGEGGIDFNRVLKEVDNMLIS